MISAIMSSVTRKRRRLAACSAAESWPNEAGEGVRWTGDSGKDLSRGEPSSQSVEVDEHSEPERWCPGSSAWDAMVAAICPKSQYVLLSSSIRYLNAEHSDQCTGYETQARKCQISQWEGVSGTLSNALCRKEKAIQTMYSA